MDIYTIADLKQLSPPKGVTIYRLVNTGFDKKGRLLGSSQTVFPSEDTITIARKHLKNYDPKKDGDPEDQIQVLLEYFTSAPRIQRNADGTTQLIGNRGEIIFRYGTLQVRTNELMLYNFLEYCNWARETKHRDPQKNVWFYRLRPELELLEKDQKRKNMIAAVGLAYDMPEAELREYARAMTNNSDPDLYKADLNLLRATMASFAETDSVGFINGSKSAKRKYKAVINEAIEHQIIEHNVATREWNRLEDLGNQQFNRKLIVRVPQGEDSFEFFIDYLVKDNSGLFDHLETLVKATRPKLEVPGPRV